MMEDQVALLYNKSYELIHLGDAPGMVYADDFTRLNKEIYELIHLLWNKRGNTIEEEARLCLSLLMGFSVCMYGNEEDERKRMKVEERVEKVLELLDNSELKRRLCTFYFNEIEEYLCPPPTA